MARGNDPGRDFDDQWHASKRAGEERAARGEGPWAEDKYLDRVNKRLARPPAHHAKPSSGCAFVLGFLVGLAWFLSEVAGRTA
jgi:hypothetical protein